MVQHYTKCWIQSLTSSHRRALEHSVLHQDFLQISSAAEIKATVLDEQMWKDFDFLSDFLGGFHEAITLLEGDASGLSDTFMAYRELDDLVEDRTSMTALMESEVSFADEWGPMKLLWEKRKKYCYSPAINLAALLDHR